MRLSRRVLPIHRKPVNEQTILALSCAPGEPLCRVVTTARLDALYADFVRAGFSSAWQVKQSGYQSPHAPVVEMIARWSGGECRVADGRNTMVAPEHQADFSSLRLAFFRALEGSKVPPSSP